MSGFVQVSRRDLIELIERVDTLQGLINGVYKNRVFIDVCNEDESDACIACPECGDAIFITHDEDFETFLCDSLSRSKDLLIRAYADEFEEDIVRVRNVQEVLGDA